MRLAAALLFLALAGCVLGADDSPAAEPAVRAHANAFAAPSCVRAGQPFDVSVSVTNDEPRAGLALVLVDAQQFGHLVNERVHLEANETKDVHARAAIGFTGPWRVFVSSPDSRAGDATLRVVEGAC